MLFESFCENCTNQIKGKNMKKTIMRTVLLTIAFAAVAQSIHHAHAEQKAELVYQGFTPDQKVVTLLSRKSYLEGLGQSLSLEETRLLLQSLKESYGDVKMNSPVLVERTESPTI